MSIQDYFVYNITVSCSQCLKKETAEVRVYFECINIVESKINLGKYIKDWQEVTIDNAQSLLCPKCAKEYEWKRERTVTKDGHEVLDLYTRYKWTTQLMKYYPNEWDTDIFCKCKSHYNNREDERSGGYGLYYWFDKHKGCYPVELTTGLGKDR